MKVGSGIGYTSGTLYKRHKQATYTPGSKYERFGRLGLLNQRNMSSMNRQAVSGYNDSFSIAGPNMFAAKAVESQGFSELAANKVLERVKQQMNALADTAESFGIANSIDDGDSSTTGNNVDETA